MFVCTFQSIVHLLKRAVAQDFCTAAYFKKYFHMFQVLLIIWNNSISIFELSFLVSNAANQNAGNKIGLK